MLLIICGSISASLRFYTFFFLGRALKTNGLAGILKVSNQRERERAAVFLPAEFHF